MTVPDEKTREEAIARALEATRTRSDRERLRLPWQGERQLFDKIRLPLDMVVLNAASHRIQSQLQSLPAEKQKIVKSDPWSEEAQAIIAEIIAATDLFEDILAEMRDPGQEDPGVVLRSGVLINGNTRVVALRKIDPQGFVDLLVLPPKPDPKDVARLELDLQEKREVKQPYTFPNSLLFLEDLKTSFHFSDEDAAKALRINKSPKKAAEDVRERTRILALIREIQERSNGAVKLTFFDELRVALEELQRAYEARKKFDPAGAEEIKEARILGILTGVEYRHLRQFDSPETIEDHVIPSLTEAEGETGSLRESIEVVLATPKPADQPLPGLEELADDYEVTGEGGNLKALVDLVALSYKKETISLPSADGPIETSWEELEKGIAESLDYAADGAKIQKSAQQSLSGPAQQLREAHTRVDRALHAYRKVADAPKFAVGKFEYELKKLGQAVDGVKAELQKRSPRR